MCQGYCMVVFENECKKTNTRSQTQKYLSLGKFTLAPLCEPHKIEIVQEKRQVTFIAIVVGRHESMRKPRSSNANWMRKSANRQMLTCTAARKRQKPRNMRRNVQLRHRSSLSSRKQKALSLSVRQKLKRFVRKAWLKRKP